MRCEIGWPIVTLVPGSARHPRRNSAAGRRESGSLSLEADIDFSSFDACTCSSNSPGPCASPWRRLPAAGQDLLHAPADLVGLGQRRTWSVLTLIVSCPHRIRRNAVPNGSSPRWLPGAQHGDAADQRADPTKRQCLCEPRLTSAPAAIVAAHDGRGTWEERVQTPAVTIIATPSYASSATM